MAGETIGTLSRADGSEKETVESVVWQRNCFFFWAIFFGINDDLDNGQMQVDKVEKGKCIKKLIVLSKIE